MHGHLLRYLLIIFTAASVVFAQPNPNDGYLRGIVRLEDGAPLPGVRVTVQGVAVNQTFITGADGVFRGQFPPGDIRVTALGMEMKATIASRVMSEIAVILPLTGVVLKVVYDDGTPAVATISAAYRSAREMQKNLIGQPLGERGIWFPEVPADITRFSAIAKIDAEGRRQVKQEWDIEQPEKIRTLTMTIRHLPPMKLAVLDSDGKPVANAPVTARVSYTIWNLEHWQDKPDSGSGYHLDTKGFSTDALGVLNLGVLPPSKGEIFLAAGGKAGGRIPFEINADGTTAVASYTVNLSFRSVVQTVVDAGGKPQPGALVHASYSWQGQGTILDAHADDNGVVTWYNLPPARVIVWGDNVPAGVIPRDAVKVDGSLPAPKVEGARFTYFQLANTGDQPFTATWYITPREGYGPGPYIRRCVPSADKSISETNPGASGKRISIAVITDTSPPRLAYLQDIYQPYTEERGNVTLTLPLREIPELRGRLLAPGGREIPGASRLVVVPRAPIELPPIACQALKLESGMAVFERPDGAFSVPLPAPGAYRLQVDLFDDAVPTPAELELEVKPGVNSCAISLPEPLFTVPAGTELSWATRSDPSHFHSLRVAAHAPDMPVFGPADEMLAIWGRVQPNRLLLYAPLAEKDQLRYLNLRSVYLSMIAPNGNPAMGEHYLRPLLPRPRNVFRDLIPGDPACPETCVFSIQPGMVKRQELWSGSYTVTSGDYLYLTADIPEDGPPEVALHMDNTQFRPFHNEAARRMAIFPKFDYDTFFKQGKGGISIAGNVPYLVMYPLEPSRAAGTGIMLAPETTKLSVEWLGVGVMRDVPVPDAGNIVLPAWQDGETLQARVLTAEGVPYANQDLRLRTSYTWPEYFYKLKTDADGRFAVKGLMPGAVFINMGDDDTPGGWTVDLPEAGLLEVTLRMTKTPIVVEQGYPGDVPRYSACWWVPEKGSLVQLPFSWHFFSSFELPAGPGWLWATDRAGGSQCMRLETIAGSYHVRKFAAGGSPLSLYLPYRPFQGFPQQVVLIGEGPLAGLRAEYDYITWQPLPQLGVTLAQFDAIPPGPYRVIVYTPQGRKEAKVTVTGYGAYAMIDR